ncbi:hypothetical protein [Aquipuribacter hungaricus]|uniref:hypothetical protein n=1 Tax=Aquipuribacter hungaricus TaxID=545624 RepID=UPI0030ECC5D1
MKARVWAPVALGALLVVGVLGVRGDSAADEEDLRAEAPSTLTAEPSVDDRAEPGAVRLAADGIEGMRLGSPGTGFAWPILGSGGDPVAADDLPGGCMPSYGSGSVQGRTWDTGAWLVDDVVSAVLVSRRNTNLVTPAGLSTWLGPTLGSPVEAASELPGARTRTERPAGAQGPEVTVVVASADGVEVVFSDVVFDVEAVPEEARGRITTIEVRHPRARACSEEALASFSPSALEGVGTDQVLGLDGLTAAPIGSDATVLEDLPGAQPQGGGLGGCEAFFLSTGTGSVRVVAVDGVVVSTSLWGDAGDGTYGEFPFRLGMTAEEVSAAVPAEAGPALEIGTDAVEVTLGQRLIRLDLAPPVHWVEDVDVPVSHGPPAVFTITVQDLGVSDEAVNC